MKIIVVDRKKTGTIVCLAAFMVMLFAMEFALHNRLQEASFAQVTKGTTATYKSVLNDKLVFSIPSTWNIEELTSKVEGTLYEAKITSQDKNITGIITVKNIPNDMDRFLEKNEEPVTLNGNISKKYCIEKNEVLVKVVFNYDKNMSEKDVTKQINSVLKSLKYNE